MGILFLASLFFNYLFEPFIVNRAEHKMDFFWICAVHGGVSSVVIGFFFWPLSRIPNIGEKWKMKEEVISLLTVLILIGIGQFLIRDIIYDNPNNWSWRYFFEEIRNTLLVGSLFIAFWVPYNFRRLYNHNYSNALHMTPLMQGKVKEPKQPVIFIQTQVKSDAFELELEHFLFARAEKNYAEIFFRKEDKVEKLLKRIAFKELEMQLNSFPQIIKTHRSYLVNLEMVNGISGNAQGYKLTLKESQDIIPVSRSMIPEFEQMISQYN